MEEPRAHASIMGRDPVGSPAKETIVLPGGLELEELPWLSYSPCKIQATLCEQGSTNKQELWPV